MATGRRTLVVLGIAGMIQPISNTTGWLLHHQGRTNDMFRLAMFGGPLVVLSIIVGLPWGAIGVAKSYVIGQLLLTNISYWYVGRRGPVRTIDFYRTIGPVLLAAVFALLACWIFRMWLHPKSPISGVLLCSLVALVTTFLVLMATRPGRRALLDAKNSIYLMLRKKV
jgi:PST family polysaccharide transporter